ncbi:MAG: TrkH family potassium uptake protein [Bacteroidaceae bacterium]|nr:TrkH family potassium uptake protein [Bacteroidaceae bacterium]
MTTELIHIRAIHKVVGYLLAIEASVLALCSLIPLYTRESDMFAFLASSLITACFSVLFILFGKNENSRESLSRRDGYLVVVLSWTLFSLFGCLPFIISRYIPNFTNAFFETISGFTTTGASIVGNVEILPHGLLFWRSLTQWMGGLGIVFFTVAVLPFFGVGEVQLFAAEAIGPAHGKLHPRIGVSGRWILTLYVMLTVSCAIVLNICGMGFFDSVNHAMTTIATSGYSTRNASIGAFHSVLIEDVITIFTFLSGINFSLLFLLFFKGKIGKLLHDTEFLYYLGCTLGLSLVLGIVITANTQNSLRESLHLASFQVISMLTTTGFVTNDVYNWPAPVYMILSVAMCLGACAGSTTGGMKGVRSVILFRSLKNEANRILHPNAVLPVRVNGKVVPETTRQTIFTFTVCYVALIAISWIIYIIAGLNMSDAFYAATAFISNSGTAVGSFDAANSFDTTLSWDILSTGAKWYTCFLMLVSRLEIFAVLLIFTPAFWRKA